MISLYPFRPAGVGEAHGMAVGTASDQQVEKAASRLRGPGILLGIGLVGFVDGILLHQILQWHHLISSRGADSTDTVESLERNTLGDGLFHAFTWLLAVVGVWLLWRRTNERRWAGSGRPLVGWMLVGWGLFNLVEGVIAHQILGLHHGARRRWPSDGLRPRLSRVRRAACFSGWLLVRSDRDLPPATS